MNPQFMRKETATGLAAIAVAGFGAGAAAGVMDAKGMGSVNLKYALDAGPAVFLASFGFRGIGKLSRQLGYSLGFMGHNIGNFAVEPNDGRYSPELSLDSERRLNYERRIKSGLKEASEQHVILPSARDGIVAEIAAGLGYVSGRLYSHFA